MHSVTQSVASEGILLFVVNSSKQCKAHITYAVSAARFSMKLSIILIKSFMIDKVYKRQQLKAI